MTDEYLQLQDLKRAYNLGQTKIRLSSGDEVTYRSLDEMDRIIRRLEAQLSPKKKRRRFGVQLRVNKGL